MSVSYSRPVAPEDQLFLEDLFLATHRAEFAPVGLEPSQLDQLLRMQARAQRLGYARDFPSAVDHILLSAEQGSPAGRLLVDRSANDIHIVDIAIHPEHQRRGLGTAALRRLLVESEHTSRPVRLQVQPANPALALYTRLGFRVTAAGVHLQMEYRPACSAVTHAASEPQGLSPEASRWAARIGTRYVASEPGGPTLQTLSLNAVTPSIASPRTSFSLFFRAVHGDAFPQGTYTLRAAGEHDHSHDEEVLFLVPLGPDRGHMQYEAVFNHLSA